MIIIPIKIIVITESASIIGYLLIAYNAKFSSRSLRIIKSFYLDG